MELRKTGRCKYKFGIFQHSDDIKAMRAVKITWRISVDRIDKSLRIESECKPTFKGQEVEDKAAKQENTEEVFGFCFLFFLFKDRNKHIFMVIIKQEKIMMCE